MGMCMCLFGARVRAVGHAVAHVSVSVDMYCVRRVARVCAPFCGGAFTLCVGGGYGGACRFACVCVWIRSCRGIPVGRSEGLFAFLRNAGAEGGIMLTPGGQPIISHSSYALG